MYFRIVSLAIHISFWDMSVWKLRPVIFKDNLQWIKHVSILFLILLLLIHSFQNYRQCSFQTTDTVKTLLCAESSWIWGRKKEVAFEMRGGEEGRKISMRMSMYLTRKVISKVINWQRKHAIYQWQGRENPKDT